jgi:hypothetical protein
METKRTDGKDVSDASTITGGTHVQSTGDLPNFDLSGVGVAKPDNTDEAAKLAEAKKVEDDKNKATADAEAIRLAKEAEVNNGSEDNRETFFEFEDKKFKLDDKGNALNEDGSIFKTKDELDALKTTDIENELPPLIQDVIRLNGVEILDETGKPKVYEDTEEGLVQYAQDFAKHEVEQSQKAFFGQLPQVKELAQYLVNGGTEEDFYKSKLASWKNTTLDKNNEVQLSDIVKKDLLFKGHTDKEAEELIALFKDSNKLEEKGEAALENQRRLEAQKESEKKANDIEKQKAYQKSVNDYWDNVSTVVKTGKLEHITIPEVDKDAFFKYIGTAVDKNGNSQADLDEKNAKLEFNLQLQYLRYKKFDLSKLIANTANTERARNLRERISKEKKEINNGGGDAAPELVKPSDVNISLNSLFSIKD